MILTMTPEQFEKLKETLDHADSQALHMDTPTSGVLTNHDVTLRFNFDGTANCNVDLISKNSWLCRRCPDSVVDEHIQQMLTKFLTQ
jgi:hypothetical protein